MDHPPPPGRPSGRWRALAYVLVFAGLLLTAGSVADRVAGILPAPGIGFYGVSKAMLNQITWELAVELGPDIGSARWLRPW